MVEGSGTLMVDDADRALSEMNDALLKLFQRIENKWLKAATDDILTRYDIGKMIQTAMADQVKYGEDAAEKVATGLGMSSALLYTYQQVAATWGREELQHALTRSAGKSGYHLSWTHVAYLSSVRRIADKRKMVTRCFRECLTAQDLQGIIRHLLGSKGNNKKGRPRVVPKSPAAGLATLHRLTSTLVNAQDVLEEAVFDRIAGSPSSYASEEIAGQLREAAEEQARLELTAQNNGQKIQAALDAVERSIRSQSSGALEKEASSRRRVAKKVKKASGAASRAKTAAATARRKVKKVKKRKKRTAGAA